jgi:CelD/BcsL family acetyltransferase involved in cellulose biosynthesis
VTLRIDWHSRIDEIEALEPAWRALESTVADRMVLSTFDYLVPWYRHYYCQGIQGRPLFGAAWEGTELVGIAPLVRRWDILGHVPVRRIDFAAYSAEGGEFLVRDNRPELVIEFLHALRKAGGFDVISLNNMEPGSPKLCALEDGVSAMRLAMERTEHCYAAIDLKEGYEAYSRALNASLKGDVRREMRRRATRLEQTGGAALGGGRFVTDPEHMAVCVERMFAINDLSWKAKQDGPMAGHHRAFYRELTSRFVRRGMVDLPILTIGGVDAAYVVGIAERGIYYDITVSYRDEFSALSPGLYLMQGILKTLPSLGIHKVISHGAHEYKRRWAITFPIVRRVFLFPPGLRPALSRFLKFRLAPALGRTDPMFD